MFFNDDFYDEVWSQLPVSEDVYLMYNSCVLKLKKTNDDNDYEIGVATSCDNEMLATYTIEIDNNYAVVKSGPNCSLDEFALDFGSDATSDLNEILHGQNLDNYVIGQVNPSECVGCIDT